MIITKDMLDDFINQAIEERNRINNRCKRYDKRSIDYKFWLNQYNLIQGEIQAYAHIKSLLDVNVKRIIEGSDE